MVFGNANAPVTTASFTNPGVYTLRLTATDTEFTVSDEMAVTVLEPAADGECGTGSGDHVAGYGDAQRDGDRRWSYRGSVLETFWSFVSGPGAVVFPDATTLMRRRSSRCRARTCCG